MTPPSERRDDNAMLNMLTQLNETVMAMRKELSEHMASEPHDIAEAIEEAFQKSFPNGDADGHRRAHEAVIKTVEDKAEFWHDMRKSVMKWGIVGFAIWAIKTLVEAGALWIQHGGHIK